MEENRSRKEFEETYHDLLQSMSIQQLLWLNEMVIDYVKIKEDVHYQKSISKFKRGDKVHWEKDGIHYQGWVIKTNKKTVSVAELEPPYRQWRIDPNFISKEKS